MESRRTFARRDSRTGIALRWRLKDGLVAKRVSSADAYLKARFRAAQTDRLESRLEFG
jgi:hypothetical protein